MFNVFRTIIELFCNWSCKQFVALVFLSNLKLKCSSSPCQEYSCQVTFREQWNDNRLQFDDMNGKISYLVLTDPDRIWKPDLFFSNEKRGHFHEIIMPNVLLRIYPNGNVLFSIRISLGNHHDNLPISCSYLFLTVLACPMDLKYYPLDRQTCSIKMASCE